MKWLTSLFAPKPQDQSAHVAKERLQVIFAHERARANSPDYLPKIQKEITAVICKYVKIDADQVAVEFEQKGDRSVLELNITLPEEAEKAANKTKLTKAKSTKTSKKA